ASAEPLERLVCLLEREFLDLGPHGHARREREELLPVAARQVRDRADDALLPQELVREARDVAHVDPRADDDPAAGEGTERRRYELACGREDDRCVELLGRGL